MRSKFDVQSPVKNINTQIDYLIYNTDGKKYLSEIVDGCEMNWKFSYELMQKLIKEKLIDVQHCSNNTCQGVVKKTSRKK